MEHSPQELIQCIYDCCTENLDFEWQLITMSFKEYGQTLDATFTFAENVYAPNKEYQPSNIVAPLNAASILMGKYNDEGANYVGLDIVIEKDGPIKVTGKKS